MIRFALITLAVLVAGCGSDEETASPTPAQQPLATATAEPTKTTTTRAKRGTKVKVVDSQFGKILGDRRGQAFYFFDKETSRTSECYGACARAWPPVLTKGRPVAGKGARAGLLGTSRRRGGKLQVTYRNRPLYYYVDDAPGRVLCHNVAEFGGLWLVIEPNGVPAD